MKEYSSHQTENPLPLALIKDSFKTYFHKMEKLLRKGIRGIGTKWFPLVGKSVSTSQNKGFVVTWR